MICLGRSGTRACRRGSLQGAGGANAAAHEHALRSRKRTRVAVARHVLHCDVHFERARVREIAQPCIARHDWLRLAITPHLRRVGHRDLPERDMLLFDRVLAAFLAWSVLLLRCDCDLAILLDNLLHKHLPN